MYPIQEPSGALFLYVKAEKFPIVCQAGAVRCRREMSPCLSMCFKLKTEKQSLRKHLWRGSCELPSVLSLAFQLREVPEESNWYAWGSSMPGYWAAWQSDWGRVAAVWKGTRHVGEFQKGVFCCQPRRTWGPAGLTHASDGCDIYGPTCVSFIQRQLPG